MLRDGWLWGGVAAYAGLYFALGAVRYAAHRNFVDLGIFAQTAASAFGCFCNTVEGSHWAVHFSPVLYLAGALMRVWQSALALVALQAVAGALTAPPVYGVLAHHADRRTARLGALVVFLYPPLAGVIFIDFHENGLAPAAVAWLLWAFDAGWTAGTIVFALLTLSVKEDQALFLAIAGAIGAAAYRSDPRRARLAAMVGAAGAVVFVVYFAAIVPHVRAAIVPQTGWAPVRFYAWSAADWRALFPGGILARVGFLLLAFVPLLFVPFRSPAVLLAIAPLGEVLASRMSTTYTMGSHYAGAWAGWVLYAFAAGIVAIRRHSPQRARVVLYWSVGLCVAEFAAADPLHPGYFLHARTPADTALDRFIATLPKEASVATQEEAYTHMAATNPNAALLPETPGTPVDTCYILLDRAFSGSPRLVESAPLVQRLLGASAYKPVRRDGKIILYKRTQDCR